jgi:hypothetical protein
MISPVLDYIDASEKVKPLRLSNSHKQNPHGKKVITNLLMKCHSATEDTEADYEEVEKFIKMWRTHFVETIKPKFLPRGWNIEHKI